MLQVRKRGSHTGAEREPAARVHDIRGGAAGIPGGALQEASSRLLLIMLLTIDN